MIKSKQIIVLTNINDFFGQTRKPWVSIDTELFIKTLKKSGYQVHNYTFDEVLNNDKNIENSFVIYTFSQKFHSRQYINDVILHLSKKNIVIPSLDMLKCHENKGYQELYKKELDIKSLKAYYFSNPAYIKKYDIEFPTVLKAISGSNGKEVYLAKNQNELLYLLNKHFVSKKIFDKLDLIRRKYFRKEKYYKEYPNYSNKTDLEQYAEYVTTYKPFILQEFVNNLEYDYRVLALHNKYYITKRHVRNNDFRASGAKKFDFDFTPDDKLLNFAKKIHLKFNNPFSSMDICEKNGEYYLIEYQFLHFGINVFIKSNKFYSNENDIWISYKKEAKFEVELANALIKYLKTKN